MLGRPKHLLGTARPCSPRAELPAGLAQLLAGSAISPEGQRACHVPETVEAHAQRPRSAHALKLKRLQCTAPHLVVVARSLRLYVIYVYFGLGSLSFFTPSSPPRRPSPSQGPCGGEAVCARACPRGS